MPVGIPEDSIHDGGDYRGGGRIKQIMNPRPKHSFVTVVHPMTGLVAPIRVNGLDDLQDHKDAGFLVVREHLSDDPNALQVEFWPEKRELAKKEKPEKRGVTPWLAEQIRQRQAENKRKMDFWAATSPKGAAERNLVAAATAAAVTASRAVPVAQVQSVPPAPPADAADTKPDKPAKADKPEKAK